MAEVTIRNSSTQEERVVDETAAPFFPDWDVLDKSVRPKPVTPTTSKES